MEKKNKYLHKAKNWNLISLVFKAIGLVLTVIALPSTLNPPKNEYTEEVYGTAEAAKQALENYQYSTSLLNRLFVIAGVIVSVAVLVLLFMNHRKLQEEILPTKLPYYLYLIWSFVGLVQNLLTAPVVESTEIDNFNMLVNGATIGIVIIAALPIVLTLVYLFKADTGEQE